MNKDRLNVLKERLRRDHIFEVLDQDGVNIRQDSEIIHILTKGAGGNKSESIYFEAFGVEEKGKSTFHSKKISFKTARILEDFGIQVIQL